MRMETENRKQLGGKGGILELPSKGEEEINPKYLLSSLVRLCWVLAGHVSRGAVGRLEGHGAKRTLVEDFAVFLVDVHFQHGKGHEDNSTMDAPGGCTKKEPSYSYSVASNTHAKWCRWRQAPGYGESSFSLFNSNVEESRRNTIQKFTSWLDLTTRCLRQANKIYKGSLQRLKQPRKNKGRRGSAKCQPCLCESQFRNRYQWRTKVKVSDEISR